ncbi:hypothetical protein KCP78_01400 [Salmonella enterica subsp. enterica]|nr:hypothetical protein KCP78_01400 [Salmonella enterica subsp. enterica]
MARNFFPDAQRRWILHRCLYRCLPFYAGGRDQRDKTIEKARGKCSGAIGVPGFSTIICIWSSASLSEE